DHVVQVQVVLSLRRVQGGDDTDTNRRLSVERIILEDNIVASAGRNSRERQLHVLSQAVVKPFKDRLRPRTAPRRDCLQNSSVVNVTEILQPVREPALIQNPATDTESDRPPLVAVHRLFNNRERFLSHHRTSIPRTRASKALI